MTLQENDHGQFSPLPHFWRRCGKTNQEYLEKLQRRSAGIIEGPGKPN